MFPSELPPGAPRSEILDSELPPGGDIIVAPRGGLFCFVCRTSVPRGLRNLEQHIAGKKHKMHNQRFKSDADKLRLRQRYLDESDKQANWLAAAAAAPTTTTTTVGGSNQQNPVTTSASAAGTGPAVVPSVVGAPGPADVAAATGTGIGVGVLNDASILHQTMSGATANFSAAGGVPQTVTVIPSPTLTPVPASAAQISTAPSPSAITSTAYAIIDPALASTTATATATPATIATLTPIGTPAATPSVTQPINGSPPASDCTIEPNMSQLTNNHPTAQIPQSSDQPPSQTVKADKGLPSNQGALLTSTVHAPSEDASELKPDVQVLNPPSVPLANMSNPVVGFDVMPQLDSSVVNDQTAKVEAADGVPSKPAQNTLTGSGVAIDSLPDGVMIDKGSFINDILQESDDTDTDTDKGDISEVSPKGSDDAKDKPSQIPNRSDMRAEEKDSDTQMTPMRAYKARRLSGGSLSYKVPEDARPEQFFDSMVPESKRSDTARKLREKFAAASEVIKRNEPSLPPDDNQLNDFIPLLSDGKEKKKEEQLQKTKEECIVLHDVNGDELPPWLLDRPATENILYSADSSIALHFEILQFMQFMSPTAAEKQARQELFVAVEAIAKLLWPNCTAEAFGSHATDLALPSSDVDVCVMNTPDNGKSMLEFERLAEAIRNVPGFAKRVQIVTAKVPLVKIISRRTKMNCDISIGVDNGVQNVPLIKSYINQFPALRPLVLVVKCFLHERNLNEVFTGGLGSYTILLLVASHLQMMAYNFPHGKANLGMQLQTFFELYGRIMNVAIAGIQGRDNGRYFEKTDRYPFTSHEVLRFCVEDPSNHDNELGRNGYNCLYVRTSFAKASKALVEWRRDNSECRPTPLGEIINVDLELKSRRRAVTEDLERIGRHPIRETVDGITGNNQKRQMNNSGLRGDSSSGGVSRGRAHNNYSYSGRPYSDPRRRSSSSPDRMRKFERDPRLGKRRRSSLGGGDDSTSATDNAQLHAGSMNSGVDMRMAMGAPGHGMRAGMGMNTGTPVGATATGAVNMGMGMDMDMDMGGMNGGGTGHINPGVSSVADGAGVGVGMGMGRALAMDMHMPVGMNMTTGTVSHGHGVAPHMMTGDGFVGGNNPVAMNVGFQQQSQYAQQHTQQQPSPPPPQQHQHQQPLPPHQHHPPHQFLMNMDSSQMPHDNTMYAPNLVGGTAANYGAVNMMHNTQPSVDNINNGPDQYINNGSDQYNSNAQFHSPGAGPGLARRTKQKRRRSRK